KRDWSSDVCSSDLVFLLIHGQFVEVDRLKLHEFIRVHLFKLWPTLVDLFPRNASGGESIRGSFVGVAQLNAILFAEISQRALALAITLFEVENQIRYEHR